MKILQQLVEAGIVVLPVCFECSHGDRNLMHGGAIGPAQINANVAAAAPSSQRARRSAAIHCGVATREKVELEMTSGASRPLAIESKPFDAIL